MKPAHRSALAADAAIVNAPNICVARRRTTGASEVPSMAPATTNTGMISMNPRLPKLSPNHHVDHAPFMTASTVNDASAPSEKALDSTHISESAHRITMTRYHGWYT